MRLDHGLLILPLLALPLLPVGCSRPAPVAEAAPAPAAPAIPGPPEGLTPSVTDIIAASKADEWRALDPETTLYMDFPKGRVVIEMAPDFAPNHVANVKALSREGYFVDGAVTRVQDNYVAQVGFSNGFAAARDDTSMWLTHCYGTVGVGRDNDDDSGGGTELYAIIGQSPRMLDRNITVLGRVVQGMELLSALPRGTGDIGFYKTPKEYVHYADIKVAADVPEDKRTNLEVMRTDGASFATLVNSRRWRKDAFYHHPVGRIGLCNIAVPSRPAAIGGGR